MSLWFVNRLESNYEVRCSYWRMITAIEGPIVAIKGDVEWKHFSSLWAIGDVRAVM